MPAYVVRSKEQSLEDFFIEYSHCISDLNGLDSEQIISELNGCMYVELAALACGSEIEDFVNFALEYYKEDV